MRIFRDEDERDEYGDFMYDRLIDWLAEEEEAKKREEEAKLEDE